MTPTLLTNTALALALLALGEALRRRRARPELLHLLWLVVLARLLAPPLLHLPILPRGEPGGRAIAPAAATASLPASLPRPMVRKPDAGQLAGFAWVTVAAGILVVAARRWRRFRRTVASTSIAAPRLAAQVALLARRVGLGRPPRLRVVDLAVPPAVTPAWGGAELLFPRRLLARLSPSQLDALLLHELSHLRRRDHWVRLFELVVTALCWWHPVAWWTRRRLREAEEASCDRAVVRLLGDPVPYAEALVETLAFTRRHPSPLPAAAVGAVSRRDLEERLSMLFDTPHVARLRLVTRWTLAGAAIATLALFPIRARTAEVEATTQPGEEIQAALADLEREAMALDEQRRALEERRAGLERALHRDAIEEQRRALREAAEQLRRDGHDAERRGVELELERLAMQEQLEGRRWELERSLHEELEPRQREAQRLVLEAEARRREGDRRTADELVAQADAMRHEAERLQGSVERQALELERQHREQLLADLERHLAVQRDALEERAAEESRRQQEALAELEKRLAELERRAEPEGTSP